MLSRCVPTGNIGNHHISYFSVGASKKVGVREMSMYDMKEWVKFLISTLIAIGIIGFIILCATVPAIGEIIVTVLLVAVSLAGLSFIIYVLIFGW